MGVIGPARQRGDCCDGLSYCYHRNDGLFSINVFPINDLNFARGTVYPKKKRGKMYNSHLYINEDEHNHIYGHKELNSGE